MKIFTIDSEGWTETYENSFSVESSLEYIDVTNNEYVVLDSFGYLYVWEPDSSCRCGYKLQVTQHRDLTLLSKINGHGGIDAFKI